MRVFYPARPDGLKDGINGYKETPMFRTSLSWLIEGWLHTFLAPVLHHLALAALTLVVPKLAWLHPLSWIKLPRCYDDLPPCLSKDGGKLALIVWSHGLTGTSEEHGVLAAALALRGFVVALPQHSDGSSSLSDIQKGQAQGGMKHKIRYIHPNYEKYDTTFRQRQAEHRAKEVEEARQIVLSSDLSRVVDRGKVVVAGFSFGAATAGLVASMRPEHYSAAVLVDGWWHIHLEKHRISQDLPLQVHEHGISIPSLFIGSAEFQSYPKMKDGTERVQSKVPRKEVHVIPETRHGNFMDLVWWVPISLSMGLNFSGTAAPHDTYARYSGLVADFAERHTLEAKYIPMD